MAVAGGIHLRNMVGWKSNSSVGSGAVLLLWLIVYSAGAAYISLHPQYQLAQIPRRPPQKQSVAEPMSTECAVENVDRVSCGNPNIIEAECEAINCCFEGGLCYYGKAGKRPMTRI